MWSIFRITMAALLALLVAAPAPAQDEGSGAQFRGQILTPEPPAPPSPEPQAPAVKPAPSKSKAAKPRASAAPAPAKKPASSHKGKATTVQKTPSAPASAKKPAPSGKATTVQKPAKAPAVRATQPAKPAPTQSLRKGPAPKAPAKGAAAPPGFRINAKAAYLMNMDTGEVYYAQDADRLIPPASVTKVMTLLLIREAMARGQLSPSATIPVSARAACVGGSSMHLVPGEHAPLMELIKGISVASANNACMAVAEYLGKGNPAAFVARMNAKARELGMRRTVFKNPSGLPAAGQVSTARDLALLARAYLRRFPESLAIHAMTTHTYRGVAHRNANSLLDTYPGADGLKTGFVCASGFNIAATAKRDGTRLLAVVLGATSSGVRHRETVKLLDYGFARAGKAN